jgi:DNA repair protein SbcD/Mre11
MLKLLHFADTHIDIAAHGRHDPLTGLPLRVLDFLKALDTIIDAAIEEKVDLVLFAGDAYKDRTPVPTFQREFGKRIVRLSQAGIPTLLLVGNHDLSPAVGRAHALQEFDTLQVPHTHVLGKPQFLTPLELENLPLQVIALPWISRSGLMAAMQSEGSEDSAVITLMEAKITELIQRWLEKADPTLPVILTAHASVQGAVFGAERSVMLGADLVLPGSLVRDPRLDYVALGHIHKAQNLNQGSHPPVIYPGSIERVDFGEALDDKFYVIARVERGGTQVEWHKIPGRRFVDRKVVIQADDDFYEKVMAVLPPQEEVTDSIFRLMVEYPRLMESQLDEPALRRYAAPSFEFHLVRRPQNETRLRIPAGRTLGSLLPDDLIDLYLKTLNGNEDENQSLKTLAGEIFKSSFIDEIPV